MADGVYLIETVTASGFVLRTAPDDLKLECGFETDMVAVGADGDEPWGAIGWSGADGVVSIRYWVAPDHRGRKLATAMLKAVAGPMFASGAERLEVRAPVRDLAAIRAAMRAGFRPEGVLRAAAPGGTDALSLGLLPGDGRGPAPRALPDLPGGELTDGTVSLRPLRPGDAEAHLRHRTAPDVYKGAALQLPPNLDELTEMCEWRSAVEWLRGRSAFMVIDDGEGYRGTIGLYDVTRLVGTGVIGYDLSADARGRGYATRAVDLMCRWAFEEVGIDRLEAGTDVHNAASQAVLRRAGFRLEGIERGGLPATDGTRRDTLLWAKLSCD